MSSLLSSTPLNPSVEAIVALTASEMLIEKSFFVALATCAFGVLYYTVQIAATQRLAVRHKKLS